MEKRKIILPIFIAAIMIFSTFGIIFSSFADNSETFKYRDYRFTYDGQIWFTFKNNQRIEFLTDPRELDNLYIGDIINKIFSYNKVYLTVEPDQNLSIEQQIFKNVLNQLFQKPVHLNPNKYHKSFPD